MYKAVVLFSGGQDSTTCLCWAKNRFDEVEALSFDYGQRHAVELVQAKAICKKLSVKQTIIDLSFLGSLVRSALTGDGDVNDKHEDRPNLPASFVPNRNALFLTLAHAYAQKVGAEVLVIGASQVDYSGYPDCRSEFLMRMMIALNLGSDSQIDIVAPLINLSKAETFKLAQAEECLDLVIELSHTCYQGDHETKHAWGFGCGNCPACGLREQGWQQAFGDEQ